MPLHPDPRTITFNPLMTDITQSNSQLPTISGKQTPDKPKRARALKLNDIEEIARLIATRKLTETEACLTLGITPNVFFRWKQRHKNQTNIDTLITRMRADKIQGLIDNIENVGNGIGVKQRDWRASAWIAERVAPEKFNLNKDNSTAQAPTVNIQIMSDALKRIYSTQDSTNQISELNSPPCQTVRRFIPVRNTTTKPDGEGC